jgi:hypothetical protein
VTCLIGQQLVKAVEQSTQAEFHGQDLAALVSRPHARARVGGAGDLDIRVLSAERLEPGTFTGPAGTFRQRTEITKAQRDILNTLKIDAPPRIHQLKPAVEP